MNRSKAVWFVVSMLLVSSMILTACAPATPAATQAPAAQPTAAPKPTTAAAQPTAAPKPTEPPAPTVVPPTVVAPGTKSKDPTTMTEMSFGDPETLDPAHDYETAGSQKLQNIYEGLVTYAGSRIVAMSFCEPRS